MKTLIMISGTIGVGKTTTCRELQKIDKSACINRLLALEGAIQGVKKILLPDKVKAI